MALVECSECGASISDKAQACVKCGAPIVSSATPKTGERQAATANPSKGGGWAMKALTWLVGALVVVSCMSVGRDGAAPSQGFDESHALALCQKTIEMVSRDPEKADVPFVRNQGRGEVAKFVWGPTTRMARLRNGFGIEVATTAECYVDLATKQITSLTVEGKVLR